MTQGETHEKTIPYNQSTCGTYVSSSLSFSESVDTKPEDYDRSSAIVTMDCCEITLKDRFVNSNSIPQSISYDDGVFYGTLVETDRELVWGGYYVTFKGDKNIALDRVFTMATMVPY